jgi:hypothetical protein
MPPKEPKEERINEFIKALKDELKKDKPLKDPHTEHFLERITRMGRKIPPSEILTRLSHLNRRSSRKYPSEEDTWLAMARTVYEMWEKETYPEEQPPVV